MNTLLLNLNKKTQRYIRQHEQFFLFLLVGGLNTVFGYGVFALFIFLGFQYYTAVFLTTVIGILFNFKTTGGLVFKNKNRKLLLKFFLNAGFIYLLTVGLMKILNGFISNDYATGAIASAVMPFLSFYLNKRIFTPKKSVATPLSAANLQ